MADVCKSSVIWPDASSGTGDTLDLQRFHLQVRRQSSLLTTPWRGAHRRERRISRAVEWQLRCWPDEHLCLSYKPGGYVSSPVGTEPFGDCCSDLYMFV